MDGQELTARKNEADFKQGVAAGIPVAIGYGPIALAYGLLAKSVGLSALDCTAMSVIVFAGASQFVALNLLSAGIGPGQVLLTTFLINLRHLLMSASLSEKMHVSSRIKRAILAFGVTDESFAVASIRKKDVSDGYMAGLILISYGAWVTGSFLGYFVGSVLPEAVQASMGIALYAMFIGLLVPPAKKSRKVMFLALSAAFLSWIFSKVLEGGWPMIIAAASASFLASVFQREEGEPGD